MTCVAGLVNGGRVYVATDSIGADVSTYSVSIRADKKVFRRGPYVIGFTTSFRMGQVLKYGGLLPEPPDGCDLHAFMCSTFIDYIRTLFKYTGFGRPGGDRGDEGGQFIVGVKGRLFIVESDFQVAEPSEGFAAVGCGMQLALGSLYTTEHVLGIVEPKLRLSYALAAAEAFSAYVRRPFVIETDADVDDDIEILSIEEAPAEA